MRIQGIEVRNYAGLNQQFIPLEPGITILAGKNNVGKSALLTAADFSTGASAGYSKADSRLCLICALEGGEQQLIHDGKQFSDIGDTPLRIEFMPNSNGPIFIGGWLRSPWTEADLQVLEPVSNRPETAARATFTTSGSLLQKSMLPGSPIADLTKPLTRALYVAPHRIVQPSAALQEQKNIPRSGAELASFLMTLRGKSQRLFDSIQQAFLSMFPEFSSINTPPAGNAVSIELESKSGDRYPLARCGTGLEQMLVLLTAVLCSESDQIVLLDEPHTFLFPSAERKFLEVLSSLERKRILIATHSAISINSVPADRVIYVERPGESFQARRSRVGGGKQTPQILHELGYRNSDLLFHDELIFVEGPSDSELLLGLLRKAHADGASPLEGNIGCPDLAGTGEYTSAASIQKDVLREEKLIASIGRSSIPHMYLFDGDKSEHDAVLRDTRAQGTIPIKYAFLKRYELENYFLRPVSIAKAINRDLSVTGEVGEVTEDQIVADLQHWVNSAQGGPLNEIERGKLFPKDLNWPDEVKVKASRVLDRIYEKYQLPYHKSKSGRLILEFLDLTEEMRRELQATTREIVALLRPAADAPAA